MMPLLAPAAAVTPANNAIRLPPARPAASPRGPLPPLPLAPSPEQVLRNPAIANMLLLVATNAGLLRRPQLRGRDLRSPRAQLEALLGDPSLAKALHLLAQRQHLVPQEPVKARQGSPLPREFLAHAEQVTGTRLKTHAGTQGDAQALAQPACDDASTKRSRNQAGAQLAAQRMVAKVFNPGAFLSRPQAARVLIDPETRALLYRMAADQGRVVVVPSQGAAWALLDVEAATRHALAAKLGCAPAGICYSERRAPTGRLVQIDAARLERARRSNWTFFVPPQVLAVPADAAALQASLGAADRSHLVGRYQLILPTPVLATATPAAPKRFNAYRHGDGEGLEILRLWEEVEANLGMRQAWNFGFDPDYAGDAAELVKLCADWNITPRLVGPTPAGARARLLHRSAVQLYEDTPATRATFAAEDSAGARATYGALNLDQDARLNGLPTRPLPSFFIGA